MIINPVKEKIGISCDALPGGADYSLTQLFAIDYQKPLKHNFFVMPKSMNYGNSIS
jgi:hypothetical protein